MDEAQRKVEERRATIESKRGTEIAELLKCLTSGGSFLKCLTSGEPWDDLRPNILSSLSSSEATFYTL